MKKSERNKKIDLSLENIIARIPKNAPKWLAMVCVGIFVISPFIMSILCLRKQSIDYTIYAHPRIMKKWIWHIAKITGMLAITIRIGQLQVSGQKIKPWIKKNPIYVCFLILALWMIVATTVNGWNSRVLYGTGLRFESIFMQLGYFLVLFPAAALLKDKQMKLWLARLHELVSLLLVPAAFVLWRTQIDSLRFIWTPALTAIYSNTNYYGYYLSVSVPLAAAMFVMEKNAFLKLFSAVTVAANTVALAYNNTLGAWVACTMTMIFLLIAHGIIERKINLNVIAIAVLYLICLVLPAYAQSNLQNNLFQFGTDFSNILTGAENAGSAGSGRWRIWKGCIKLVGENPVFGIGFEGVDVLELKEITYNYRPHNEILQYTLFYGIPAGVLYFVGCLGIFIRALKKRKIMEPITLACLTAAFGYLVSSMFGLTLFCTTPFLFLFLGMGYVNSEVTT